MALDVSYHLGGIFEIGTILENSMCVVSVCVLCVYIMCVLDVCQCKTWNAIFLTSWD